MSETDAADKQADPLSPEELKAELLCDLKTLEEEIRSIMIKIQETDEANFNVLVPSLQHKLANKNKELISKIKKLEKLSGMRYVTTVAAWSRDGTLSRIAGTDRFNLILSIIIGIVMGMCIIPIFSHMPGFTIRFADDLIVFFILLAAIFILCIHSVRFKKKWRIIVLSAIAILTQAIDVIEFIIGKEIIFG